MLPTTQEWTCENLTLRPLVHLGLRVVQPFLYSVILFASCWWALAGACLSRAGSCRAKVSCGSPTAQHQPGFCVIFPNETHPFCSSCTWCFNQIQNTLRSLMGMKSHYTELITFNFNCGEKGFIHVVYKIKLFWCLFHFTIENLDTPLGQMGIDWLSYTPVLGSLGWKQKVKMPFLGSFPLQLIKAEGCISRRKCSVGIFTAPLSQDSLDIWYKPAVKDQETCSAHCLLTYKQCPIKDSFYCWKAIKE